MWSVYQNKKKTHKKQQPREAILFVTPRTVAHQAPPSMGFSRQEYWSGLPFPSPGDLPDPGIKPRSLTLQADALTSEPPGKKRSELQIRKERYIHLNADFQRIAGTDRKAILRDQCKDIEENSRMRKTSDLFKKIRDTKGIFHAKMGLIKDRNDLDLTEAEISRRGGKNTQNNFTKKIFTTQIIMNHS